MKKIKTIMIIGGDTPLIEMVNKIFSNEYTVITSSNIQDARLKLVTERPSTILLNSSLTQGQSIKFISDISADAKYNQVPFIALTSNDTQESDLARLLETGVFDFITPPLSYQTVKTRISNCLKTVMLKEEAMLVAYTDPLTGLYNRKFFLEKIIGEKDRIHRYDREAAIAVISIDNFPRVAADFGSQIADQALMQIAKIASGALRHSDTLARVDRGDFAILYPESSAASAFISVERIRNSIANYPWDHKIQKDLKITLSAGIAEYGSLESIQNWYQHAEKAAAEANKSGGNKTILFGDLSNASKKQAS